jgi:hypothetical protein
MHPNDRNSDHSFWLEVLGAYCFPIIVFALAIIPGLNFSYSGQGGIGWLFVSQLF